MRAIQPFSFSATACSERTTERSLWGRVWRSIGSASGRLAEVLKLLTCRVRRVTGTQIAFEILPFPTPNISADASFVEVLTC